MGDVNALLNQRLKKSENSSKMAAMAKQSASGHLTSFSGIFNIVELNEHEKKTLEMILKEHLVHEEDVSVDLKKLISITSEVKAINNQATLLHGERIKKAHEILTHYRDGAFTSWLIAAYGNRQTPYNLMQYYEFCEAIPKILRPQIESMPRQAIYTLASREGTIKQKCVIIENYKGETKAELLNQIRAAFPLEAKDKRRQKFGVKAIQTLKDFQIELKAKFQTLSLADKHSILEILMEIQEHMHLVDH